MGGGSAPAPDAARRYLHQREQGPRGLRERRRVSVGTGGGEFGAEQLEGARLLLDQDAGLGGERVEVETDQPFAEGGAQALVEHRLQQWTQGQAVLGGDQVDGAALEGDPHDPTALDQLGERLGGEAVEAGEQAEVGRLRGGLGLEAAEVLDHGGRGGGGRSSRCWRASSARPSARRPSTPPSAAGPPGRCSALAGLTGGRPGRRAAGRSGCW